jgi:hypothetical protein
VGLHGLCRRVDPGQRGLRHRGAPYRNARHAHHCRCRAPPGHGRVRAGHHHADFRDGARPSGPGRRDDDRRGTRGDPRGVPGGPVATAPRDGLRRVGHRGHVGPRRRRLPRRPRGLASCVLDHGASDHRCRRHDLAHPTAHGATRRRPGAGAAGSARTPLRGRARRRVGGKRGLGGGARGPARGCGRRHRAHASPRREGRRSALPRQHALTGRPPFGSSPPTCSRCAGAAGRASG